MERTINPFNCIIAGENPIKSSAKNKLLYKLARIEIPEHAQAIEYEGHTLDLSYKVSNISKLVDVSHGNSERHYITPVPNLYDCDGLILPEELNAPITHWNHRRLGSIDLVVTRDRRVFSNKPKQEIEPLVTDIVTKFVLYRCQYLFDKYVQKTRSELA